MKHLQLGAAGKKFPGKKSIVTKKTINRLGYAFLGAFLIFFLIQWYLENRENRLLKKYYKTLAIVLEVHKPEVIHGSHTGTFQYKVEGKVYVFTQIGDYTLLKLGDTVEIKYATEDPSVAKVSDKFYMEKYHHLKNSF